ncbi:MAG: nucleoside transporter C-terminal domain-containing protein [Pseudomonadota bacterium]
MNPRPLDFLPPLHYRRVLIPLEIDSMQALLGLPCMVLLAWLVSSDRSRFPLRLVLVGVALQCLLALLLLKTEPLQDALLVVNRLVIVLEQATAAGTSLVFGFVGGGATPFEVSAPEHSFILAFRALPIVIVFAALSALLWHWRVIPLLITGFARLLDKSMGLSGSVSVGSAASVFVGMVEAPLLVKPRLRDMTDCELFMLMSCGMATVAGTVLGLYAGILVATIPTALSHILVASLISAPAAILLAGVMVPPEIQPREQAAHMPSPYASSMDALVTGTGEGLRLLANIVGMLIVFVALVYLVDALLALIPADGPPLTLIRIFGSLLAPLAWLTGIPWQEAPLAGELLASKVFVNELVAYLELAQLPAGSLSERSAIILTYALCGFANFGSLGIMLGGLTALCPERSVDILRLAPRSLWSGLLATCMTGAVVSLVL